MVDSPCLFALGGGIWKREEREREREMDPLLLPPLSGAASSMSNEVMMDQVKQQLAQEHVEEFLGVTFCVQATFGTIREHLRL